MSVSRQYVSVSLLNIFVKYSAFKLIHFLSEVLNCLNLVTWLHLVRVQDMENSCLRCSLRHVQKEIFPEENSVSNPLEF